MCHFFCAEACSGASEEAMGWRARAVMEAGYCVLVHASLCSVQRILPRSGCGYMQDEAHMRVEHCIGFGSCSVVHCVEDGGKLNRGNIV